MKRIMTVGAALVVWILMDSGDLAAQHQMGGQMQMGGQAGQEQSPSQRPMMDMMCPMMSGGMGMMSNMMGGQMGRSGMGMMRMMGSSQTDPKTMGRMLQLRGDILKAIGDVMVKHGKAMEEAK